MIKKENSRMLMDQIDTTIQDIQNIKQDMSLLKKQIETKLSILQTYTQLAGSMAVAINDIEEKTKTKDTIVFMLDKDKIVGGEYSSYGHTIHPQLAGLSDQMFNFITSTGPLFKDNATVTFTYNNTTVTNGEAVTETITDYKYQYCDMLKHEADTTKKDVFQIFPVDHIKMTIEQKPTNLIGNTYCNLIEICPYLPGSFTINEINVWTLEQYLSGQEMDQLSAETINVGDEIYKDVGPERIYLGKTYQPWKIEFDITINVEQNGYPFGLQHLYFYNAQMDTQNSYVICKIHKDGYIDRLTDDITITTPTGKKSFIPQNAEYKYYGAFENNTLQVPLPINGSFARNLKDVYVYVPIEEPAKAITFNNIVVRP